MKYPMNLTEMREYLADLVDADDFDGRELRHYILNYMKEVDVKEEYEYEVNIDNARRRRPYCLLCESLQFQ